MRCLVFCRHMPEQNPAEKIIESGEKVAEQIRTGEGGMTTELAIKKIDDEVATAMIEVDQMQSIAVSEDGHYTSPGVEDAVRRARAEHDAARAELAAASEQAKAKILKIVVPKAATKVEVAVKSGSDTEVTVSGGGSSGPDMGEKILNAGIGAIHDPAAALTGAAEGVIDFLSGGSKKEKS